MRIGLPLAALLPDKGLTFSPTQYACRAKKRMHHLFPNSFLDKVKKIVYNMLN